MNHRKSPEIFCTSLRTYQLWYGLICLLFLPLLPLHSQTSIQWDKVYGGSQFEELSKIQQTSDGGYILAGSTNSGISGDVTEANRGQSDFWVVKIDANGNKQWDKRFGGDLTDLGIGRRALGCLNPRKPQCTHEYR